MAIGICLNAGGVQDVVVVISRKGERQTAGGARSPRGHIVEHLKCSDKGLEDKSSIQDSSSPGLCGCFPAINLFGRGENGKSETEQKSHRSSSKEAHLSARFRGNVL